MATFEQVSYSKPEAFELKEASPEDKISPEELRYALGVVATEQAGDAFDGATRPELRVAFDSSVGGDRSANAA